MLDEVFDRAWCWWHTLNERTQRNIVLIAFAAFTVFAYRDGWLNLEG